MDQQDIQNMLQEFMRTNPEYSPILQYEFGQANSYAPVVNTKTGASSAGAAAKTGVDLVMSLLFGVK